jgi:hypothetical protein
MYIFNLDSQQQNVKQRSASLRFVQVPTYKTIAVLDALSLSCGHRQKISGSDSVVALLMLCFCVSIYFSRVERNLKRLSSMGSMPLMI